MSIVVNVEVDYSYDGGNQESVVAEEYYSEVDEGGYESPRLVSEEEVNNASEYDAYNASEESFEEEAYEEEEPYVEESNQQYETNNEYFSQPHYEGGSKSKE